MKRYAEGDFIILLLYFDDMLIVWNGTKMIALLKKSLSKSFVMKDLGPAKQMLDMKISRDRSNKLFWLPLERYIEKVLKIFNKMQHLLTLRLQVITNWLLNNVLQGRRRKKK